MLVTISGQRIPANPWNVLSLPRVENLDRFRHVAPWLERWVKDRVQFAIVGMASSTRLPTNDANFKIHLQPASDVECNPLKLTKQGNTPLEFFVVSGQGVSFLV
jgi:hypothetical protein